ncbi:hypothetical protein OKA04_11825 [Luteolibacter flavescens]|uniref:Cardiolipin synthase N-terminal domain-containing protein n=1 Tax=Luteolibacter flavescens TaxID=1859460 RepID=A0ABT3FQ26_9BACT|nr:hypothetical protein [Luteolibacter flavescens]MCW1885419.1 hypothetical protein [Luteolibacter flavescens]
MIDTLLACATCAANFKDDGPNAAGWSIFVMLCIILPMLAGVVFFMVRLIRRSDLGLDPELRDDLPAAAAAAPTR